MSLGRLSIDVGANIASFESDMGRAARIAKKRSQAIQQQMKVATKAVTSGLAVAAAGIVTITGSTAKFADELSKLSQKVGTSVDFLSKYDFLASQTGTNIETVGNAIKKMEKSINDANNGLSTSARAFDDLGISLDTLNQLSPEKQFELISQSLSGIESQSLKTGTAMDIFGRSGTELLPLFDLTKTQIDDLTQTVRDYGTVVSEQQADAAVKFNDSLDSLQRNAEGFSNILAFSLMPAMTEIIDQFNDGTIRDANEDWSVLTNTLASVYGGALLVREGFSTIGQAIGLMAAKSMQAFTIVTNGLENFVNRFKRGALIISSLWDDTANEAESKLGREIQELSRQTDELIKQFNSKDDDNAFFNQVSKGFEDVFKRITKVRNALTKQRKEFVANKKPAKDLENALKGIGDQASLTEKELNKIGSDFDRIVDEFLSPLEKLEKQYQEQQESIKKWQNANIANFEIWNQAEQLLEKSTKKFKEDTKAIKNNEKALKNQKTPYDQLIQSLKDELDLIGKKGPELTKAIAKQELARIGITEATKGQKEYNQYLEELLVLLGKIDQKDTEITFDQKVTGISDLISSIESMSDAFDNFGDDIGRGLQNVGRSIQSALNSISSISSSFGDSSAFKSLGKIAGSVSVVGQIAGFINNIAGGGLFGTSYKTDSTSQNFGIGPGGGFGFVETRESRKRSLFRGTKKRTTVSDLAAQAQKDIESLFTTIENIIATSSLAVGGNLEELISGAFKQTFDKDGNLKSEFSTVLGKRYEETFGQFSQRLIAENIIGVLDSVLPQVEHTVTNYIRDFENIEFGAPGIIPVTSTVLTGEANALADRFRDQGAEALLEFANFALKAVEDIQAGNELLASLTDTTDLIQELGQANETLSQTYERVAGATQLLESSLGIIDTSLDLTREEFVRFATAIADAAGGLQQASSLWQTYFETFYTEQELLEKRIADATATRDTLLTDLGLDTDITPEAFRQQFEDIFPTLTPEEVTQWLRAGAAIGAVIDLSADITAAAEASEQALAEEAEANARALSNMMDDIASSIEDLDLSPFAKRLKEVTKAFNEQIKTARELGASEQELAMIQAYATRQIQDAVNALESNISTSITDLYGTQLDVINSQIASLEQQQSLSQQLAQASQQRYRDEIAALQNLAGYIDSLFLNPTLTTLNPFEQLQEAQAQFDQLFAQAQSGDASAINALPDIANTLLGLGRDNFASSPAFTALFDTITGQLGSLGLGGPSTVLENINTADPRLLELQTQQRELLSQIATQERFDEVFAVANQIAELTSVTGESFASLADRLNLPIEQFLSDLGVNLGDDLTNLTVDTASSIADVARTLGIEVSELADSVGASLGDLADTESLLNDALEAAIGTLPNGIQDSLTGLLQNIETAADPTQQEQSLAELIEFAQTLPDDQRAALEPFFDQIDPTSDAQRQIDSIDNINNTNQQIQLGINELRENNQQGFRNLLEEFERLRGSNDDVNSQILTLLAQALS